MTSKQFDELVQAMNMIHERLIRVENWMLRQEGLIEEGQHEEQKDDEPLQ